MIEGMLRDLRNAVRVLIKNPSFSAIAIATLALGIGANSAIFSLTDQVLLRSLPVPKPDELVVLRSPGPNTGRIWSDGDSATSFSYPLYLELRDRNPVFSGLLARFAAPVSVSGGSQTERANGELVTGNYFEVLGVGAALGRTFTQEDDRVPGGHPVVVLSYGYWARRFGSDPSVLNKPLTVNGMSMTVVGVSREGFNGVQVGQLPDVFVPMAMKTTITPNWDGLKDYKDHFLALIGRLKPGISREKGQQSFQPVYRGILESLLPHMGNWPADIRERFLDKPILLDAGARGRDVVQRDAKAPILVLMGMVGLVLLIACANVASLSLARGAARQREIAVRMALGAGRARLVKQFLLESIVLSLSGGAVGLFVGAWTSHLLVSSIPASIGIEGLSGEMDLRMLGFTLGLSLLTGILFGLVPAFRSTSLNLEQTLREQGSSVSSGLSQVRFRKVVVAMQIVLTAVLLVGAGLFARSLANLRNIDLGMRPDHIIEFSIAPALSGYSVERAKTLFDEVREGLASLPGVVSASAAEIALFTDSNASSNVTVEGYQAAENEETHVYYNSIGADFFATMGIPLISGREFTASDTAKGPKVAVINEAMVRRFFGDRNPIGQRFTFGSGNVKPDIEIIGVVKDSKHAGVRDPERPFAYLPYTQQARLRALTFYVRTKIDPALLAGALRSEVQKHDNDLPVYQLKTFEAQLDESLFADRFVTSLSVCFGLLAAALAAIGLYGVMAYTVARRTREIGIRMALGATRLRVLSLMFRDVGTLLAVGLVAGLPAAFALGRVTESLLFGVKAGDPSIFALVAVVLALVALAGAYVPARRAAGVDPMKALRYE